MRGNPAEIDLLVLDVDGVMTDGRIVYDDAGHELKFFCVQDGAGLKFWHRAGKKSVIITGRSSGITIRRASELGITSVKQGALNKLPALHEALAELNIPAHRAAYMGDDLPDLPPMRECGLGITVPNAVELVRQQADWVSPRPGGQAAVRWAIEELLKAAGAWDEILARYV